MKVVRTMLVGLMALSLPTCGFFDLGWLLGGDDSVIPVEFTSRASSLASESIFMAGPQATGLLVDQFDMLIPGGGILGELAQAVQWRLFEPLTDSSVPDYCPYLEPSGSGSSVRCQQIRDLATQASLLLSSPLVSSTLQDITTGQSLTSGEEAFVAAWTHEAVLTGIDTGAIQAVELLRSLSICDDSPDAYESAFLLGEQQGMALLEETETDVLQELGESPCNTDIVATTIHAEARSRANAYNADHTICRGYTEFELAESVDLEQAESYRREGMVEGLERSYEVLRVRLLNEQALQSYETESPREDPSDPCRCFARHGGNGPVYCFLESQYDSYPPTYGGDLTDMEERGYEQCGGECTSATPVGSPLVADLDNNGVGLSLWETIPFDLAATGELVRIPALTGDDALLAMDLNGNGNIDSGVELFGNNSWCGDQRCVDGIEALAQHDENNDQLINESDPSFDQLLLWRDLNRDGRSTSDEFTDLNTANVHAIGLVARLDLAWTDERGNSAMRALSFIRSDGTGGVIHDVWFALSFDEMPANPRSSGITSTLPNRLGLVVQPAEMETP